MIRRLLRRALAALGIAAAVYGAASLTGGWLGTPPWWIVLRPTHISDEEGVRFTSVMWREPREGREWISAAVIAAGLGLAAFSLRPRKATTVATARDTTAA